MKKWILILEHYIDTWRCTLIVPLLTAAEFVIGITPYFDLLVNVNKTLICQLRLQLDFKQHEHVTAGLRETTCTAKPMNMKRESIWKWFCTTNRQRNSPWLSPLEQNTNVLYIKHFTLSFYAYTPGKLNPHHTITGAKKINIKCA